MIRATTTTAACSNPSRGVFILFEGVDRCGKTTQAKMLTEFLNKSNKSAEFMRFPNRTTQIGQTINSYLTNGCELDDHVAHLLFSANRWEAAEELKNYLSSGKHVIVDRYSYSGAAFSAAKPGMDLDWCMLPERGLPKPDAVIFLDISIEKAADRAEFGQERYEKAAFQQIVRENFFKIMKSQSPSWVVLDASKSIEEVHREVQQVVDDCLKTSSCEPLQMLD